MPFTIVGEFAKLQLVVCGTGLCLPQQRYRTSLKSCLSDLGPYRWLSGTWGYQVGIPLPTLPCPQALSVSVEGDACITEHLIFLTAH